MRSRKVTVPAGTSRSSPDAYATFVGDGVGAIVADRLGLPRPVELRRHRTGSPLVPGRVAVAGRSATASAILDRLTAAGVEATDDLGGADPLSAVIVDATGWRRVLDLDEVRAALHSTLKRLESGGRVVVLAADPGALTGVEEIAVAHAMEGIVRSTAKELRRGATANLVRLDSGADAWPAVAFFLSGRSAYVDGQALVVRPSATAARRPSATAARPSQSPKDDKPDLDPVRPLDGRVAVVTGAARGIGAAIAAVLGRDGARVLAVDVPAAGEFLAEVANSVGGVALQLDITAGEAGEVIAEHAGRLGGLDVMVHNAGITRDKLVVNMSPSQWAAVLEVNLAAQLRMDEVLLSGPLADNGRMVAVASVSGIAGNRGQTNYAASKAGVIGMVRARAAQLAGSGQTYNAVAPGFVETEMTARMPLGPRELGRRANSLSQGGRPVDVAEAVAFLAQPSSAGISGQVLRVCGQSLLGA